MIAADAATTLNRRTAELIDSWRIRPTYAALFGSTARRDGDEQSDIDVLIIPPDDTDPDDPMWSRRLTVGGKLGHIDSGHGPSHRTYRPRLLVERLGHVCSIDSARPRPSIRGNTTEQGDP